MADFNQRKPSKLAEFRYRLLGAPLDGASRRPTLSFKILRNGLVLEARTNIPEDKDYGRITLTFGPQDFFAFLTLLDGAIDAAVDTSETIAYADNPWTKQGRSPEKKLVGKVIVGKDKEGVVYIAIQSWDRSRPQVTFPVLPSGNYQFLGGPDNTAWDRPRISKLYAKSWRESLAQLMPMAYFDEYNPPPPRDNSNGGGGYNRNNNGGGGGNYNQGGQQGGGNYSKSGNNTSSSGSTDYGNDDAFPL